MATSDGLRNSQGLTRPHWGSTQEGQCAATVYHRLTDMARNYFDPNNTISLALEDVPPKDKLVALVDQPGTAPCQNSCLRLHRQSSAYFRDTRPDGRNEGAPYSQRPKLLLAKTDGWQLGTQAFLLGQYYHQVFLPQYGRGGGFPQFGVHQEKALESALSNWYASDHTDNFYLKVWDPKRHDNPTYLWNADPSLYFPRLGDVLTSALWRVRELPGTDTRKWRQAILRLVDRHTADEFASGDAYSGVSIIRGFAHRVFTEAVNAGAFDRADTRYQACFILVDHELLPASYNC